MCLRLIVTGVHQFVACTLCLLPQTRIPRKTRQNPNEVAGMVEVKGRPYHARSLDDKIIQHELLMSRIIARFHGYAPRSSAPACSSERRDGDGDGRAGGSGGGGGQQ